MIDLRDHCYFGQLNVKKRKKTDSQFLVFQLFREAGKFLNLLDGSVLPVSLLPHFKWVPG